MDVGVIIGDVPSTTDPRAHLDQLLAQVEAAQRAGVRYITIGQHFLYGDHRWLQPIPTLARLAAEVSPDMRLVTTVVLLPLYHPVVLAEELATLDIVSAGRLIVGFGLGYRTSEFQNLGVPFGERVARFEEGLELIKQLWTEPGVDHHGRFFHVQGEPHIQPWQQPRPPIWIGADRAPGVRRAARLADAWPIGPNLPVAEIVRLQAIFCEERTRLGLPVGRQPIRRDVAFGPERPAALAMFVERSAERYRSYAANERSDVAAPSASTAAIAETLAARLIHGTVEQCAADIQALARRVPIDPIIVRPYWPGMATRDVAVYLAQLGELVAGLAGTTSS